MKRLVTHSESWPGNGSFAWGESRALRDGWKRPALAEPRQTGDGSFYLGLGVAFIFAGLVIAVLFRVFG